MSEAECKCWTEPGTADCPVCSNLGTPRELAPVAGSGWGLWHHADKRWINRMFGGRAEFETKAEAARHKVKITTGKRDPISNYFRNSVHPRRLDYSNNRADR